MVEAPMLNGGSTENRWQPMSQLTWWGPSSRSTSFMAAKIGRSGQPVQNDGGRPCTLPAMALLALARREAACEEEGSAAGEEEGGAACPVGSLPPFGGG